MLQIKKELLQIKGYNEKAFFFIQGKNNSSGYRDTMVYALKFMFGLILWLLLTGVLSNNAFAQDPHFSQFYASPLYSNPGFAGTTPAHRFIANYRNQWASMPQSFVTFAFSYDYNMKHLNSGIGVMATRDRAGSANLSSTTLSFLYSYKIQLPNKWIISPGINFGYGRRDLDFSKFLFRDQIEFGDPNAPTQNPSAYSFEGVSYFDFGSGALVYNKKFWAGFSAYHMNEPNNSLRGEESKLPLKTSVHGGVRIPIYRGPKGFKRPSSIAPSFIYKRQGKFDQLDVGLHVHYDPVMAGVWYRGIPVTQQVADNISQDAVILLFGLRFQQFEVGYSYDIGISALAPSTVGSHELSLTYQFKRKLKAKVRMKNQKYIPCPTFTEAI